MVKTKFKKAVSLMLAAVMSLTAFTGIGATTAFAAVGEKADVYLVDYPRSGDTNNNGEWGHGNLNYMNGWKGLSTKYTGLRAMGSYSGNIAYCIEPGTGQRTGDTLTEKDENFFNNISPNGTISGDDIRLLIGRILQYGYRGGISTSWKSQNESDANCIAHAYATQILIWETIVGERDAGFNHVSTSGYNAVLECVSTAHPLRSKILSYYNSMVTSVQNHTKVPSFCTRSSGSAKVNELEWNGSKYVATLTDTNGVLGNYNFSANIDGVSFSVSGNKLTVSMEKAPSKEFTITAAKKNGVRRGVVDKYVTDKNGQFTTKEYVCDNDWTIREITPSEGYLLDTTVHKVGAEPQLYTVEHNQTANDVTEQVMKGNIAIIKHTDDGETQIETPENGATFEIYLKSSGSFDAAEEDERDVIVCDENGFGQTKDMPYGVYTVHQTSGWEGRELMKNFDVFIAQDGQTYRYLINNANFESYIKVVKVDAESGKNIPYAGAGFKIFDPDGNQVTMTFTYPTPTTIDTFYTDANGQLVTPEKLEYGKGYSLVEVQAPYGYVLDSTPVYFDVAEEHSSDEGGITVIKVDKPNMAQKGTVSIEKTGEVFSGVNISGVENADVIYQPVYEVKGLAGAVYEISAAEDIITPDGTLRYAKGEVVDTVTTDENGLAKSKELYLGKYTVVEITAPEGMVINKEAHDVELTYAGQEVSVTETATSFVNDRQKVAVSLEKTIEKNDIFNIGNGDEMKNISFGLFAAEELVSASGTSIPADGLIEIISLSENGKAVIKTDLPFGSYYVKELATDEHYILTDAKYPFTFSYAGQDTANVEIAVNDGKPIENKLIYGSVSGKKITENGEALGGAVIGLFKADETEFTKENALMTATSQKDGSFSFEKVPYVMEVLDNKDIIRVFPRTLSNTNTSLVLKTPKTKTSVRKIFLPSTVAQMLLERKKQIDEMKELFGDEYLDYDLVFCHSSGRPMEGQVINRALKKLIQDNDLPDVVFHSFRHASITYKLKWNGGDMKSVQGDSGHARMDMVADVYSHIIDEDRRYNAQKFEEQFYNAKGLKNAEEGKTAPMPKFETSVELLDPMAEVQKESEVEKEKPAENSTDENAALLTKLLSNPETAALLKALAKTI